MLTASDFFDLSNPQIEQLFNSCEFVWDVIPQIKSLVEQLVGDRQTIEGELMPGAYIGDGPIYIGKGAVIEPGAYIQGPAYIAAGAKVRHGAFVRENVILLEGGIIGHATEVKNALFLPDAHAPHFAYVGDSVLGHHTNLGAGTKLSNLTLISEKDRATGKRPTIKLHIDGIEYDTGLAKFGAILGDHAQTGCNSVLNPGTVIGQRSLVYANMSVRKGYYPPSSVLKFRQKSAVLPRRD